MNTFRHNDKGGVAKYVARSFSGHERNRLFLQHDEEFEDVSLLSGLDSRTDGRGFAKLDFNRDGRIDVVVAGPLSPRLQIFKNELPDGATGNSVFIDCRGGATTAKSQTQWSNRDGIGASIVAEFNGKKQTFQKSCGEGLACQNSKWIHVGLGKGQQIDKLSIDWPSGKQTIHLGIKAGSRIVVYENDVISKKQ